MRGSKWVCRRGWLAKWIWISLLGLTEWCWVLGGLAKATCAGWLAKPRWRSGLLCGYLTEW